MAGYIFNGVAPLGFFNRRRMQRRLAQRRNQFRSRYAVGIVWAVNKWVGDGWLGWNDRVWRQQVAGLKERRQLGDSDGLGDGGGICYVVPQVRHGLLVARLVATVKRLLAVRQRLFVQQGDRVCCCLEGVGNVSLTVHCVVLGKTATARLQGAVNTKNTKINKYTSPIYCIEIRIIGFHCWVWLDFN